MNTESGRALDVGAASVPRDVDLLVVGGGLAGYSAAAEAGALGATTLLIEKESKIGGATVLSGGSFAFADTPLQKSRGISDTEETLYEDLRRVGGYENDEALVRAYVENQRAGYEWLAGLGVNFDRVFVASGQSVPRAHSRNAAEVLDVVARHAHSTGRVRTSLETAALRLLRRSPGGPVIGASVSADGAVFDVRARHGVVLATGGFSRNESLLELFAPRMRNAQRMGGAGNTGDGLMMAWQLGAGFRDMGHIKGTFGNHTSAGLEDHFLLFPIYAGGIAVNAEAKRFCDESLSYKHIGDACLEQTDAVGYQIFDQRIFDRGVPGIPSMDFQADLEAGRVVSAPTLQGLAGKLRLDAAALERTVARYNSDVAAGSEGEFGRSSLCNGYGSLVPIEMPPFHAFASRTVVLATYSGLVVDDRMRVKDVFGDTIPGLYAAGGIIGGFHGMAYMTGTANGKALLFGRISARTAMER